MRFNTLNATPPNKTIINQFGGYNRNTKIGENEFYDMQNMWFDDYPIISSSFADYENNLISVGANYEITNYTVIKNSSVWVDAGTKEAETLQEDVVYVLKKATEMGNHGYKNEVYRYAASKGAEKIGEFAGKIENSQMIVLAAQVVVLAQISGTSQMCVYNTTNGNFEVKKTKFEINTTLTEVAFTFCNSTGEEYTQADLMGEGAELPQGDDIQDGALYLLYTPNREYELYVYSKQYSGWFLSTDAYLKIASPYVAKDLKQGDTLYISGVFEYTQGLVTSLEFVLYNKLNGVQSVFSILNENEFLIKGLAISTTAVIQSKGTIILDKKIPLMDFAIEHNNRIWGCRYGKNAEGEFVNEIYASALGDPTNWIAYGTNANAPYAASVGSNGDFTGVAVFGGNPIFFKEGYMHRIYGTYPANYQITTTQCHGVEKGSEKSLKNLNGLLIYKSPVDFSVFDGTLPVSISSKLGVEQANYKNCVASVDNEKYYAVVVDDLSYTNKMFIYDTKRGLWAKHTAPITVYDSVEFNGNVYFTDTTGELKISDNSVTWFLESGIWGTEYVNGQYINRIDIRMQLEPQGKASVLIQYDSSGNWEHIGTVNGNNLKTFTLPVMPRKSDHFKIKIEGIGKVKIFSITKSVKGGS